MSHEVDYVRHAFLLVLCLTHSFSEAWSFIITVPGTQLGHKVLYYHTRCLVLPPGADFRLADD